MVKKFISLVTLIFCLAAMLPISLPAYAADVAVTVDNPYWGAVDGNTIKHLPHLLSVESFMESVKGERGAAITKELYAADGETPVTSGDIADGMKLRVKAGEKESVYELKLARKIAEPALVIDNSTRYRWPAPAAGIPDYPTHGVYVFEGRMTMTEYADASITISYDNKWTRPLYFTKEGYITQTTSKTFAVQVPYELNKEYQFVAMVDLDNKKYRLYINGVLVSKDKVNGDSHTNIYPGMQMLQLSVFRPMSYFEFYTIPSVEDFDISGYRCSLKTNNQNILIDEEAAEIKINDDDILTKKNLFDSLVFESEEAKERVMLCNAMGEEITDDSAELKDSFLVRVASENGHVTVDYSIDTGKEDPNVLSKNAKDYKKFSFLKKIGVFNETEEVALTTTVSRGNFAKYLTKLADLQVTGSSESKFTDVVSGSTLSGYVNAVSDAGYMSGKGNGEFGVNSKITYNEAITALARVAGYGELGELRGGFPNGYFEVARSAKITKGVSVRGNDALTKLDAVRLMYNTLLAPYNDVIGVTQDYNIYEANENVTVLNKLRSLEMGEGRLTTNCFTDIYSSSKTTDKNMVYINGSLCKIPENSGYENYIGMKVEFFYEKDSSDPYNIIYMMPDDNTESVVVAAEDITGVSGGKLRYYNEESGAEECSIADGFSFIYNGKIYSGRTMSDLWISDGELTLIDTDNAGGYDLILARVPQIYEFKGVNKGKELIYTMTDEEVKIDEDTGSIILLDKYGEGTKISMEEIPYPSVLTMQRSKNDECVTVYVTTQIVTGEVTEKSDDTMAIGGRVYKAVPGFDQTAVEFGTSYDFKIDAFGRIAFIDNATVSSDYGFLVAFGKGKGLNARPIMRIVTAPEEYHDYTVADKIKLNNVRVESDDLDGHSALFTGGEVTKQLIKYTLDSNSQIKSVETGLVGESIDDYYMVTGGLNLLAGSYIITGDTYFLTVPVESERTEFDLYKKPSFNDSEKYAVTVYDVDEDTREAGAVIEYATESLSGSVNVGISEAWGIVKKVRHGIDNDGNDAKLLEVMNGGELKKFYVSESGTQNNPDLKFGDIIRFTLNNKGDTILSYVPEFSVKEDGTSYEIFPHTSSSDYKQRYGLAEGRNNNYVIMNDEVNSMKLIAPLIAGRCYKVDFVEETIEAATVNDYIPNVTKIYARSYLTKAPAVMVGYEFK